MAKETIDPYELARLVFEFDAYAIPANDRHAFDCSKCHVTCSVASDLIPSAFCNTCAHEVLEILSRELITVRDKAMATAAAPKPPAWEPPGGLKRPRKNYRRDGSRGRR